eukprot:PhF_6_TR40950/c1_g1_i1/m.61975
MNATDIAALEVLSHPNPSLKHNIPMKYIDIKWLHAASVHSAAFDDCGKRTICDFDEDYFLRVERPDPLHVLIDSPRSVLVLLRNGCLIEQLCKTNPQKFHTQGMIEGVDPELIQLRIRHDEQKRKAYLKFIREEYDDLVHENPHHGDLIQRMFLAEKETRSTLSPERQIAPLYAAPGKLPVHILNDDNFETLRHARSRTEDEVHRLLSLRQRIQIGSKIRERASQMRATRAEHEIEIRNEIKVQELREKGLLIAERYKLAQEKAQKLKQEQSEQVERSRVAIENREKRIQERLLKLNESKAEENKKLFEEKREKMKMKTETHRQVQLTKILETDARRQEIERHKAQELVERQATMKEVQKQKAEKQKERQGRTKELYDAILESRRQRAEQREHEAQERLEEFEAMKSELQHKRAHKAVNKEMKRLEARAKVEEMQKQHVVDMIQAISEKEEHAHKVLLEQERKHKLQAEENRLKSMDQKDELSRRALVREFEHAAKTHMYEERSNKLHTELKRRKVLTIQVRQEREAVLRAKDKVLGDMDLQDVRRRKDDSFKMYNRLLDLNEAPV